MNFNSGNFFNLSVGHSTAVFFIVSRIALEGEVLISLFETSIFEVKWFITCIFTIYNNIKFMGHKITWQTVYEWTDKKLWHRWKSNRALHHSMACSTAIVSNKVVDSNPCCEQQLCVFASFCINGHLFVHYSFKIVCRVSLQQVIIFDIV